MDFARAVMLIVQRDVSQILELAAGQIVESQPRVILVKMFVTVLLNVARPRAFVALMKSLVSPNSALKYFLISFSLILSNSRTFADPY
jgi:hypothetical protein